MRCSLRALRSRSKRVEKSWKGVKVAWGSSVLGGGGGGSGGVERFFSRSVVCNY